MQSALVALMSDKGEESGRGGKRGRDENRGAVAIRNFPIENKRAEARRYTLVAEFCLLLLADRRRPQRYRTCYSSLGWRRSIRPPSTAARVASLIRCARPRLFPAAVAAGVISPGSFLPHEKWTFCARATHADAARSISTSTASVAATTPESFR